MKRRLIHYSRSSALALLLAMLSACGKDLNQQNGSTGKDNEPFNILVIARDETPKPGVNIDGVTVVSTGFDTDYWTKLYSISQDQLLQENRQRLQGFAQTGDLDPDHKIRWGQSDHDRLDLWPITPASTAVPGRFNVNWVVRETVDGRTFNDNMTATLDAPASLNQGAFLFLHFLPGNRVAADWFANANWDTPETQWTSLAPRQEVVGALGPQRIAMKLLNTSGQNLTDVGIEPVSPAGAAKSPLDQLTEVVLARWWIGGFGDIAAGSPTAPVQDESAECAMERHGAYCEFSVVPQAAGPQVFQASLQTPHRPGRRASDGTRLRNREWRRRVAAALTSGTLDHEMASCAMCGGIENRMIFGNACPMQNPVVNENSG